MKLQEKYGKKIGMKKIKLLDGSIIETNEKCKGCFLLKNKICDYLTPIYETEEIIVNQDMEYPIPAFYIISTKTHIASIYDMNESTRKQVLDTIYLIRVALKKCLGIERVTIIHEEKDNLSHFHIWMLPIWEENKEKIIECNDKMKAFLDLYTY